MGYTNIARVTWKKSTKVWAFDGIGGECLKAAHHRTLPHITTHHRTLTEIQI